MGDDRVQAIAHRTLVIAHRGASGYLPEHTREAKALAYGQGADYLEQDVVATRDGELVVLHDIYLEAVTDVARRFPRRRRPDGHFYVIDFDLRELRELLVVERRRPDGEGRLYPGRFAADGVSFGVCTLDEEIALVQGLNRASGRSVGLYPEIKEPAWHARHGIDLTQLLLAKLAAHGYRAADDAVFVQCFDAAELLRARAELGCTMRLVLLVGAAAEPQLATAASAQELARYVQGIGPPYAELVDVAANDSPRASELACRIRDAGLALHPYTFRRESLPPYASNLEQLLEIFIGRIGVEGLFCDFPDVAVAVRDRLQGKAGRAGSAGPRA